MAGDSLAVTISIWWVKVRDAIKHPTMYRTKNYLAPEVSSAEVRKTCPRVRLVRDTFLNADTACLGASY